MRAMRSIALLRLISIPITSHNRVSAERDLPLRPGYLRRKRSVVGVRFPFSLGSGGLKGRCSPNGFDFFAVASTFSRHASQSRPLLIWVPHTSHSTLQSPPLPVEIGRAHV